MKANQGFEELVVWQKSMALTTQLYRFTKYFPKAEMYGLTSQIRRAAVSVSANIAEGSGRRTTGQFLHFLGIAKGSVRDLHTEIIVAGNLEYISKEIKEMLVNDVVEVSKILNGLMHSLEKKLPQGGSQQSSV